MHVAYGNAAWIWEIYFVDVDSQESVYRLITAYLPCLLLGVECGKIMHEARASCSIVGLIPQNRVFDKDYYVYGPKCVILPGCTYNFVNFVCTSIELIRNIFECRNSRSFYGVCCTDSFIHCSRSGHYWGNYGSHDLFEYIWSANYYQSILNNSYTRCDIHFNINVTFSLQTLYDIKDRNENNDI